MKLWGEKEWDGVMWARIEGACSIILYVIWVLNLGGDVHSVNIVFSPLIYAYNDLFGGGGLRNISIYLQKGEDV